MAEKLDSKETVNFEDLLLSNVYTQEALINLVEAKGILTNGELLEEIKIGSTSSPSPFLH